ncbi:C45 family peptidase [bacterium]|nr:C45 family peptidase [bacterium]
MHNTRNKNITGFAFLTICIASCLILPLSLNTVSSDGLIWGIPGEPYFFEDLSECTTGLASSSATPDGRPLLWKNRDCPGNEQEYHYVDNGTIPFVGLTYADETDRYFAGVNQAGFAIENSDIHNPDDNAGHDDGYVMKLALEICRTVDDFQEILDSTNNTVRLNCYNYGVFDAVGGATIFETRRRNYTRCDAVDEQNGFLIRTNFAFSGSDTATQDSYYGNHRYDRAFMLWLEAIRNNNLTPLFVYQQVSRDLTSRGINPYPLPFDGYYSGGRETLPYGYVPQSASINRETTRSVFIAQGVAEGRRPDDCVIWAMAGSPLGCIVTPLWVRAGSIPPEYDGNGNSFFNARAQELKDWVKEGAAGVNTWRLTNPEGTGIYDYILPLEAHYYDKTLQFLESPGFEYERMAAFQDEIAEQAADSLAKWRPTYNVTDVYEVGYNDGNLVLNWDEDRFGDSVKGYNILRSSTPFREGNSGEFLATVEETRFVDNNPPAGSAFYRIEIVF